MQRLRIGFGSAWRVVPLLLAVSGFSAQRLAAQDAAPAASQPVLSDQVQKLTDAIARTQSQLDETQRELNEMRRQLTALQGQMSAGAPGAAAGAPAVPAPASSSSAAQPQSESTTADLDDLRERQALQESQIATHEQEKVESESKYPIRITGMVLLSGFVNTGAVNLTATPSIAIPGAGSTGLSVRQTVLGFDARGPHLFGARSLADLRVDFNGNLQSNSSTSVYSGTGSTLLRLRTAHAALEWNSTQLYFALDRPILSPDMPTSLTAVAEPPLAWSGNLWNWIPQFGVRQDVSLAGSRDLRFEAALVDVPDPPLTPSEALTGNTTPVIATGAEQSRWPGVEGRMALLGSVSEEESSHLGVGGYFAPHRSPLGYSFDSWAATLDARLRLPAHLEFTGNFYRGLALGGLGEGAYKDFVYRIVPTVGYYYRSLNDVGGWSQMKEKFNERLELNAAFGIDNVFAGDLRHYVAPGGNFYLNLARNRTFTGNVIFSPSAYLLFSLEYRHIESSPLGGLPAGSNIIGLGAGYKF
jgi:uncharacterized coiled-coil protein SlyX